MNVCHQKKIIIHCLQLLAVLLGLMRVAGNTFKIKKLEEIGFFSGFSPLRVVCKNFYIPPYGEKVEPLFTFLTIQHQEVRL